MIEQFNPVDVEFLNFFMAGYIEQSNLFSICMNAKSYLLTPLQLQDILEKLSMMFSSIITQKGNEGIKNFLYSQKSQRRSRIKPLTEEDKQAAVEEFKRILDEQNKGNENEQNTASK